MIICKEELTPEYLSKKLGFKKSDAKFGSVDTTYQHYYGVDTDTVNLYTPEILFDMEPPEWAKGMNYE